MDSIAFTISSIGNYSVLLGLFIYVYALLGMTLYAGVYKFDSSGKFDMENGDVPRENFDNLMSSAITIF